MSAPSGPEESTAARAHATDRTRAAAAARGDDVDAPAAVALAGPTTSAASLTSKSLAGSPGSTSALISHLVPAESPNDAYMTPLGTVSLSTGVNSQAAGHLIMADVSAPSITGGHNVYTTSNTVAAAGSRPRYEGHGTSLSAVQARFSQPSPAASFTSQPRRTPHPQQAKPKKYLFGSTPPSQHATEPRTSGAPSPSLSLLVPDNLATSSPSSRELAPRTMLAGATLGGKHNHAAFFRESLHQDSGADNSSFLSAALRRGDAPSMAGGQRFMWPSGASPGASSAYEHPGHGSSGTDIDNFSSVSATTIGTSFIGTTSGQPARSVSSSVAAAQGEDSWGLPSPSYQILPSAPQSNEGTLSASRGPRAELLTGSAAFASGRPGPGQGHWRTGLSSVHASQGSVLVPPGVLDELSVPGDVLLAGSPRPEPASSALRTWHTSTAPAHTAAAATDATTAAAGSHTQSAHLRERSESSGSLRRGRGTQRRQHSGSETITGSHSTITGGFVTPTNSMASSQSLSRATTTSPAAPRPATKPFLFPKTTDPAVLPFTVAAATTAAATPGSKPLPSLLSPLSGTLAGVSTSTKHGRTSSPSYGAAGHDSSTTSTAAGDATSSTCTAEGTTNTHPGPPSHSTTTSPHTCTGSRSASGEASAATSPLTQPAAMTTAWANPPTHAPVAPLAWKGGERAELVEVTHPPAALSALLAYPYINDDGSGVAVSASSTTAVTTATASSPPSPGRSSPAGLLDSTQHTLTVSPYPPEASPTTTTTTTSTTTPSATAVSCFSGASPASASEPMTSPCSAPSSTTSPPGAHHGSADVSSAQLFSMYVAQHSARQLSAVVGEQGPPLSPVSAVTASPAAAPDSIDADGDPLCVPPPDAATDLTDSMVLCSPEDAEAFSLHTSPTTHTTVPSSSYTSADLSRHASARPVNNRSEGSSSGTTTTDNRSPVDARAPPAVGLPTTTTATTVMTNTATIPPGVVLPHATISVQPSVEARGEPVTPTIAPEHTEDEAIATFLRRRRQHRPPSLFGPASVPTTATTSVRATAGVDSASVPTSTAHSSPLGGGTAASTAVSQNGSVVVDGSQYTRGSDLAGRASSGSSPSTLASRCQSCGSPTPLQQMRHADPAQMHTARSSERLTSAGGSLPVEGSPSVRSEQTGTASLVASTLSTSQPVEARGSPTSAPAALPRRRKPAPPNLFSVSNVSASGVPGARAAPLPQRVQSQAQSSSSSTTSLAQPRWADSGASPTAATAAGTRAGSAPTSPHPSSRVSPPIMTRTHTHRNALVRLSHNGQTLVAGPFRVSAEGCLTVRNVLLLNPTRIDATAGLVGPLTPEMMTLQAMVSSGGFQSPSAMASPISTSPGAAASYHTGMGSPIAVGTTHNVSQNPNTTTGSLLSPHMPVAQAGLAAINAVAGSGALLSPQAQAPSQQQAPQARPRLLNPVGNHSSNYRSTAASSFNSPMATPEITGLAPSLHAGNTSFTLQSTSYETPYSPITYSMDNQRFPGGFSSHAMNHSQPTVTTASHAASTLTGANAAGSSGSLLYAPLGGSGQSSHNSSSTAVHAVGGEASLGMPPRAQSRGTSGAAGSGSTSVRGLFGEEQVVTATASPRAWSSRGAVAVTPANVAGSPLGSNTNGHNNPTSGSVTRTGQTKFAHFGDSATFGASGSSPTTALAGSQTRRRLASFGGSPVSATPFRAPPLAQGAHEAQPGGARTVAPLAGAPHASSQGSATARVCSSLQSQAGYCYYGGSGSIGGGAASPQNGNLEDTASSLLLPYSVVQTKLLHAAGSPQSASALAVKAVRYADLDLRMAVGEGASAAVYVAIHRPTGRRLAVKRIDLSPLCLTLDGDVLSPTAIVSQTPPAKGTAGYANAASAHRRSRRRAIPLNARAKQLELIVARELLVLHLTYRSPFVVKVYNAFFLREESALDVVMEFMHYGSLDHLMEQLEKHAKALHRASHDDPTDEKRRASAGEHTRSATTPFTAGDETPLGMADDGTVAAMTHTRSPQPDSTTTSVVSQRFSASGSECTPTVTGGSCPQMAALMSANPITDSPLCVASEDDEGIEEEEKGVAERVVAVVGEQLLRGLRDMHERGYIHRDIKPGNVLVNEHGVVKLSDFGLSQRCDERGIGVTNPLFRSTQSITRLPTPLTASPVTQSAGMSLGGSIIGQGSGAASVIGTGGGGGTPQFGNSPALRAQPAPSWTTTNASRGRLPNAPVPPISLQTPPLPMSPSSLHATSSTVSAHTPAAPNVRDHFSPHSHNTTPRPFHPTSASAHPALATATSADSNGASTVTTELPAVLAVASADDSAPPDLVDTTLPLAESAADGSHSPAPGSPPQRPRAPPSPQAALTGAGVGGDRSPFTVPSPSVHPLASLADPPTPPTNADDFGEHDSQLECGADIKRADPTSSSADSSDGEDNAFSLDKSVSEDSLRCSGTDKYMSPERQRGEPHGKPSDVWAVGVTLAEFALGFYPYDLDGVTDEFERVERMSKQVILSELATKRRVAFSPVFEDFIALATLPVAGERPTASDLLEHPFFRQWTTRPFNLKRYLAARVPVPSNAVKEEYIRKRRAEVTMQGSPSHSP